MTVFVYVCVFQEGKGRGGAHRLIRYVKRTKAKAVLFVVEFLGVGGGGREEGGFCW